MKITTVADVPDALAKDWLQHMRDFDIAHPGCVFQVFAHAPDMATRDMLAALDIDPPLPNSLGDPQMIFKTGDAIRATYEGRTVDAVVTLASPNGRSLVIVWDDGMLGGFAGMMPVWQDECGIYRCLVEGKPITLKVPG